MDKLIQLVEEISYYKYIDKKDGRYHFIAEFDKEDIEDYDVKEAKRVSVEIKESFFCTVTINLGKDYIELAVRML